MGLDVVEIVLRCEDSFGVELEDRRLEQTRTVGGLLELICEKLNLPSGSEAPRPVVRAFIPRVVAPKEGWTRDTVWSKLVQICTDQLQIADDEVSYGARFIEDLGAD